MRIGDRSAVVVWFCLCFASGCGSDGPKFAPADGVVTVDGKPLPKAIVTFLPLKGPAAMAVTDANGKFRLASGTQVGVMIGPVTATVVVPTPVGEDELADSPELKRQPKTPAETEAYRKKANELQGAQNAKKRADAQSGKPKPKVESPIDPKYAKSETSGLSYTIKANGDNHFKIQLSFQNVSSRLNLDPRLSPR